jgi:hypothetical protein
MRRGQQDDRVGLVDAAGDRREDDDAELVLLEAGSSPPGEAPHAEDLAGDLVTLT